MSSPSAPPLEVVTDLIVQKTRIDPRKIRPSSRLIDFGLDSVRAMEMIADLEEVYDLLIPDQDLMELQTLQDIASYIERRRARS